MSEARDRGIYRDAARVLPVDVDGRVLLLHVRDPERPQAPFFADTVRFSWGGRDRVQAQRYFAVALSHEAVSFDGHDRWEQETIIGYRWWSPDELQACGAATAPGLLGLMRAAVHHVDRGRAR